MGFLANRRERREQLNREAAERDRESHETLNTLMRLNTELTKRVCRMEELSLKIERKL